MKLKTIIYAVATALAFTACSNDSDSGSDLRDAVPLTVYGELAATTTTRVTYDDDGAGTFATGDIIYVTKIAVKKYEEFDIEYADENYLNIPYKYDGSKFVPVSESDTFYFDVTDAEEVKFYASNKPINGDLLDFSDQRSGLPDKVFSASAKASLSNPNVIFEFEHQLGWVTLNFSSAVTECVLSGLNYTSAYLDYYGFLSGGSNSTVLCHLTLNEDGTTTAEALLLPNLEKDEFTITVSSGGNLFSLTIANRYIFNEHYIFNIDILDKLVITSSSDDTDDTGVTIEGYTEDAHQTVTAE
jgi:hypothetical protein